MAVQALVTSILSISAPRCPPIIAQAPAPTATAGEDVARWCVSSGRPQAAIAVSAATTLSSAMADFWLCARQLSIEEGAVGRQCVLALPYLGEAQDPRWFNQVMQHINDCSEVCEYLGQSLTAASRHPTSPTNEDEPQPAPYPIMLLRSYSQNSWGDYSDENWGEPDPFESMDVDDSGLFATAGVMASDMSDGAVHARTTAWLDGVMSTVGLNEANCNMLLPQGSTNGPGYSISRARTGEQAFEHFWRAAEALHNADYVNAGHADSTLLIQPEFAPFNAGGFEAYSATLNDALSLGLDRSMQLLFMHPAFTTSHEDEVGRDFRSVEFARNTPHPTVGLLRTEMVERARHGQQVSGSPATCTLIELHERICGDDCTGLMTTEANIPSLEGGEQAAAQTAAMWESAAKEEEAKKRWLAERRAGPEGGPEGGGLLDYRKANVARPSWEQ